MAEFRGKNSTVGGIPNEIGGKNLAEFRPKLAEKTKVWRNSGPSCWKKPKVSGILSKIGENILVAEK